MGNMNVLVKQDNISFPLKTKLRMVKNLGSMVVKIVDICKIYRNKREILILSLESKNAKKEAEVVAVVEHHLNLITNSLNEFFVGNKANIASYAAIIVNNKKPLNHKEVFQQVLPKEQLEQLEMDIKHDVQQAINLLFGVKSLKIAGNKFNVDELVHHQHQQDIDVLLSEYRTSVFVAQYMTTVANKVFDQCIDTLNLSFMVEKVVREFKIGTIFISAVNCRPRDQLLSCRREIENYLTGVMINMEKRINQEMRDTTAQAFYELYDQTIASDFESRLALLMAKENKQIVKKTRKTSLYLLKQANVS